MPLGSYSATRGWSPDQIATAVDRLTHLGSVDDDGRLTAAGRAVRDDIEAVTDAMEQSIVDALGDDVDAIIDQLDASSARCIATGRRSRPTSSSGRTAMRGAARRRAATVSSTSRATSAAAGTMSCTSAADWPVNGSRS